MWPSTSYASLEQMQIVLLSNWEHVRFWAPHVPYSLRGIFQSQILQASLFLGEVGDFKCNLFFKDIQTYWFKHLVRSHQNIGSCYEAHFSRKNELETTEWEGIFPQRPPSHMVTKQLDWVALLIENNETKWGFHTVTSKGNSHYSSEAVAGCATKKVVVIAEFV